MAAMTANIGLKAPVASRASISRPACGMGRRATVVVKAQLQVQPEVSRRELLSSFAVVMATLASATPAKAFLGFGEDDKETQVEYERATTAVLERVKVNLAMSKDDSAKEETVKELRKDINQWVASYRREPKVSGRPSFGNTYSVLNALAGHFNSFGATAPIPKKRLERITKELADANLFLTRGR